MPPEQIVYASDYPYGQQPGSLLLSSRVARAAGFDDRQLRDMFAGNANRIADGEEPLEPSQPQGTEPSRSRSRRRASTSTSRWRCRSSSSRQQDAFGALGLALNATEEPNGDHREELGQIRELLDAARDLWRTLPERRTTASAPRRAPPSA